MPTAYFICGPWDGRCREIDDPREIVVPMPIQIVSSVLGCFLPSPETTPNVTYYPHRFAAGHRQWIVYSTSYGDGSYEMQVLLDSYVKHNRKP